MGLHWGSAHNVAEATSIADAAFNADIAKCSKHVVCAGPSLSPHALTVGLRIIAYAVASLLVLTLDGRTHNLIYIYIYVPHALTRRGQSVHVIALSQIRTTIGLCRD